MTGAALANYQSPENNLSNDQRGFIVGVQCGNMRARFMVVWVGEKGSSREGQVGLRAAENGIWSVALPRASDEDYYAWLADTYPDGELAPYAPLE